MPEWLGCDPAHVKSAVESNESIDVREYCREIERYSFGQHDIVHDRADVSGAGRLKSKVDNATAELMRL